MSNIKRYATELLGEDGFEEYLDDMNSNTLEPEVSNE